MMRAQSGGPWCANCGLEIAWEPVVADGKAYCCQGCALGGPCYCSYDPPEVFVPSDLGRDGEETATPNAVGRRQR